MVKVKLSVFPVDFCGAAVIELITLRLVVHFKDYAVCVVGTVSEPSCKQVHSQDAEDQPDKQNDQQRVAHGGRSGHHDPKHRLHGKDEASAGAQTNHSCSLSRRLLVTQSTALESSYICKYYLFVLCLLYPSFHLSNLSLCLANLSSGVCVHLSPQSVYLIIGACNLYNPKNYF